MGEGEQRRRWSGPSRLRRRLPSRGIASSASATSSRHRRGLGIVAVISGIGTAFSLIGAAIAVLTPVGLTIAAIVATSGTLLVVTGAGGEKALSWLAEKFTELRDWVGKVVGGISTLRRRRHRTGRRDPGLSLGVIWQQGVAALNKAWLGEGSSSSRPPTPCGTGRWQPRRSSPRSRGRVDRDDRLPLQDLDQLRHRLDDLGGSVVLGRQTGCWRSRGCSTTDSTLKPPKGGGPATESRLVELENAAQQSVTPAREREQPVQPRCRGDARSDARRDRPGLRERPGSLRRTPRRGSPNRRPRWTPRKQKLAAAIGAPARNRGRRRRERPGRPQRDLLADFEGRLSGLGAAIGKNISVTGTFSAAAVSGLARAATPPSAPPAYRQTATTPNVCWMPRGQRPAVRLTPSTGRRSSLVPVEVFEKFESRRSTKANQASQSSAELGYIDARHHDLAARTAAAGGLGRPLRHAPARPSRSSPSARSWGCHRPLAARTPPPARAPRASPFTFETGGGQHITQSLQTVQRPRRAPPPDFGSDRRFTADGVEGVDITVPSPPVLRDALLHGRAGHRVVTKTRSFLHGQDQRGLVPGFAESVRCSSSVRQAPNAATAR